MQEQALRAIAEPRRREILRMVLDREAAATEIARRFPDVTAPAVSQHLRVLVEAGLVSVRRDGRRRWYRARPEGLRGLREYLEGFWRSALDDLAMEAEAEERRRGRGPDAERS